MLRTSSLEKLLSRKMDRKEFLLYIGLLLLAISGLSHRLKSITELTTINSSDTQPSHEFGIGPYGGLQKKGKA